MELPLAATSAAAAATTATNLSLSSPTTLKPLTIVLKVGSSSLSSSDGRTLALSSIVLLVEFIISLRHQGHRVVLVSSGAVACGCIRLALPNRPTVLREKQAVAAVGQSRLMRIYDDAFTSYNQPIAQILLTRDNLSARHHYENALHTLDCLLDMGIVPIVNENDTVSVEELRVGDNDTLSALVSSLIEADYLFLLTDVDGLYTADPRINPAAKRIPVIKSIDELQEQIEATSIPHNNNPPDPNHLSNIHKLTSSSNKSDESKVYRTQANEDEKLNVDSNNINNNDVDFHHNMHQPLLNIGKTKVSDPPPAVSSSFAALSTSLSSVGSRWGTGGMATKLQAARIATSAGVTVAIIKANSLQHCLDIIQGKRDHGSVFLPVARPLLGRKRWIAHGLRPSGSLWCDAGAVNALQRSHASLFAAGIIRVDGNFQAQSSVRIMAIQPQHKHKQHTCIAFKLKTPKPQAQSNGQTMSHQETPHAPMTSCHCNCSTIPLTRLHHATIATSASSTSSANSTSTASLSHPSSSSSSSSNLSSCDCCCCSNGQEIGLGVVNYSSEEIRKIQGVHSTSHSLILGYEGPEEIVHRASAAIHHKIYNKEITAKN